MFVLQFVIHFITLVVNSVFHIFIKNLKLPIRSTQIRLVGQQVGKLFLLLVHLGVPQKIILFFPVDVSVLVCSSVRNYMDIDELGNIFAYCSTRFCCYKCHCTLLIKITCPKNLDRDTFSFNITSTLTGTSINNTIDLRCRSSA